MRSTLLSLLFLLLVSPLLAEHGTPHFHNITRENGLAQATVTSVLEGRKGFMWMGTAEGLHRYDGYEFKIYKHSLRDSNSLSNDHVTALCEDSTDHLWIGTFVGQLNRFDKRTESFERFDITDKDGAPNRYPITCISYDKDGSILVGLDGGGMVTIDEQSGDQTHFSTENSELTNDFIKSFNPEANDLGFWIGTVQGLSLFKSGQFKTFESLRVFDNQFVSDVLHDGVYLYITTIGQGLQIWNSKTEELSALQPPNYRGARFMNFIVKDHSGSMWIGTEGAGLLRLHDGHFERFRNDAYDNRSLVGDNVRTGCTDSRGMLWFGCVNGLSHYDPSYHLFNLYRSFEYKGEGTNSNVYCIYEDRQGIVWLGTLSGGLVRFNPETGERKVYPILRDGNVETKAVRAIFEDSGGTLWIGSRDEGLFSFDRRSEVFKHHPAGEEVNLKTIRCIYEDSKKRLWVGSNWGLFRYDKQAEKYAVYASRYQRNNPIYQIYEDETRGELILCTFRSGLHLFDMKKEAFTVLRHAEDSSSPSANALMCIEAIGKDSFLIGTYGGGVNIFERNKYKFTAITNLAGLPNNVVYGILPQGDHIYWLSTNDGIVRYDLLKGKFRRFDLHYYLQGLEFNEGAYCKSSDGTYYIGGPGGFNTFKPADFPAYQEPRNIVVTKFKKLNDEVDLGQSIMYTKQVEIAYNENLISFDFVALNFSQENAYAYKLDGYDGEWIHTGKNRTAYYTRLSPGTYTFKVKAAGPNGEYGPELSAMSVIVKRPFWSTWWFIGLSGLVLLLIILIIFRVRTRAISRELRHRLVDLELRALRSQMNPHFIFNSLNSIQYFVLKNEPKQAYGYLTKFSNLMRMILQNSRMRYISLEAEVSWLKTYLDLEKLRMENEMEYIIHIDPGLDQENIFIPSMILQPYVENAIIHGLLPKETDRELTISFHTENKKLICIVQDNGIGRKRSAELNAERTKKHRSQGLRLTGERLEMMSIPGKAPATMEIRDLSDEGGNVLGTQVIIELPILHAQDVKPSE